MKRESQWFKLRYLSLCYFIQVEWDHGYLNFEAGNPCETVISFRTGIVIIRLSQGGRTLYEKAFREAWTVAILAATVSDNLRFELFSFWCKMRKSLFA